MERSSSDISTTQKHVSVRKIDNIKEKTMRNKNFLCKVINSFKKNSSTGRVTCVNLKNEELLSILMIRGSYVECNSSFLDSEIYLALCKAKKYLDVHIAPTVEYLDMHRPLSARQIYCSQLAMNMIITKKYNDALHEFMDCIDDYGKSDNRNISVNEFALYNCILQCFMFMLENEKNQVTTSDEIDEIGEQNN